MEELTIRFPSASTNIKEETIGAHTYLTLSHPLPGQIEIIRPTLALPPVPQVVQTPVRTTTSTTQIVSASPLRYPGLLPPVTSRAIVPAQPTFVNPGVRSYASPTFVNTPSGQIVPAVGSYSSPTIINTPSGPVVSSYSSPTFVNTPSGPVVSSYSSPTIVNTPSGPMLLSPRSIPQIPNYYNFVPPVLNNGAACIGQENTLQLRVKGFFNVDDLVKNLENYVDVKCTEVRSDGKGSKMLTIHFDNGDHTNAAYEALKNLYGKSKDVEIYK